MSELLKKTLDSCRELLETIDAEGKITQPVIDKFTEFEANEHEWLLDKTRKIWDKLDNEDNE